MCKAGEVTDTYREELEVRSHYEGGHMFDVSFWPRQSFLELDEDVRERVWRKLELVAEAAAKLATNMVKGTVKYSHDSWSIKEWLNFALDDAVDVVNYLYLLRAAVNRVEEVKYNRSDTSPTTLSLYQSQNIVPDPKYDETEKVFECESLNLGPHLTTAQEGGSCLTTAQLDYLRLLGIEIGKVDPC